MNADLMFRVMNDTTQASQDSVVCVCILILYRNKLEKWPPGTEKYNEIFQHLFISEESPVGEHISITVD